MLDRPSNPYKYYLPKVHVVNYQDEACLFELVFSLVRGFKFLENLLIGLGSSEIKVSIDIKTKNS